uniref:LAS1-like protein n=1 Tax=Erpetoichthys calabaricus TaxID=27687 RepID=A0A8C4SLV8_ERPCA
MLIRQLRWRRDLAVGVPVYPGNLSVLLLMNRVKMLRKLSSPAAFHVVAWINKGEWDQVLEYLYCQDCNLQKYALERISAWKGRYGSSTPIAVESTADLVRCQVIDSCGQVAPEELVLLYGMALVRFVNLITEPKQKMVTIPLRRLAREMNIPEWIVNLRHQLTHGRLPTLNWCRKGCEFVLDWLRKEYWSRQLGSIPSEYCELGSDEADVKEEEEEMAETNEEENKEKGAVRTPRRYGRLSKNAERLSSRCYLLCSCFLKRHAARCFAYLKARRARIDF